MTASFILLLIFRLLHSPSLSAAPLDDHYPPALDRAVLKGLDFLARQQQADGSFTGLDEQGPRIAPAAQALLAFLSAGQTPVAGRHALATRNAIDFIVRQLPDDGDFGRADGSGLIGHAHITLALASAYGLDPDAARRPSIKEALKKSLAFILATQDARPEPRAGGWREGGGGGEGKLVATLWMVLSLKSLQDAELNVPREALHHAAAFVRECGKRNPTAFANRDGDPTPQSNAAGIAVLLLIESDGNLPMKGPAKFLLEHRVPEDAADFLPDTYITALAAMLSGDPTASASWKPTRDLLVNKQTEEGSWYPPRQPPVGLGTVAATSNAVMTLAMPYRLLPMYGR